VKHNSGDSVEIITAILESHRVTGRFTVVVDDRPLAVLNLDALERLDLRVGTSVTGKRDAIQREESALHAYDRALNMLAARSRSARDLEQQLIRKGETAEDVKSAIARLIDARLLDDATFARQLVRSKLLGSGHSARRLRQELGKRGIAGELADEAVREVVKEEEIDERVLVEQVARKKLRSLGRLEAPARERRLFAFLARRGFDTDVIRQTMASLGAEPNDPGRES
jgi:regulatory protein